MNTEIVQTVGSMNAGDWAATIANGNLAEMMHLHIDALHKYFQVIEDKAQHSIQRKGPFGTAFVEYPSGTAADYSAVWDEEKKAFVGAEIQMNGQEFFLSERHMTCVTPDKKRMIRVSFANKSAYIDGNAADGEHVMVGFKDGLFSYQKGEMLIRQTPDKKGLIEEQIRGVDTIPVGTYHFGDARYEELDGVRMQIQQSLYTTAEKKHLDNLFQPKGKKREVVQR